MTVSAQTPINRSTGNGVTTVFPYTFKIISSADMEVSVNGVVKTLTVDYTLSGVGNDAGGNVTMLVAPATSTSVVRRRNMALTRSTDYQDQGKLPASTLDSDLDSAVLMIQQVDEQIGRALTLPAGIVGISAELPGPVPANLLGWSEDGSKIRNYTLEEAGVTPASSIPYTPAGDISSTTVQAAINELDTEKARVAGNDGQVFRVGTALGASDAIPLSQGDDRYAPIERMPRVKPPGFSYVPGNIFSCSAPGQAKHDIDLEWEFRTDYASVMGSEGGLSTPGDVWVDPVNGSDSNDGSIGRPLKTLKYALTVTVGTIWLKPGRYEEKFDARYSDRPGRAMMIKAWGPIGSAIFVGKGQQPSAMAWTASGSGYTATPSGGELAELVLFIGDGKEIPIQYKTSTAAVDAQGYGWYQNPTTKDIYLRYEGRNINTDKAKFEIMYKTPGNNYFAGAKLFLKGITFRGGNQLDVVYQDANRPVLYAQDCTFEYMAGANVHTEGAICFTQRCTSRRAIVNDGFNYYDSTAAGLTPDGVATQALEIDNICTDNGVPESEGFVNFPSNQDRNKQGSSGHGSTMVCRVNGRYEGNYGQDIADTGVGSKTWMVGSVCGNPGNYLVYSAVPGGYYGLWTEGDAWLDTVTSGGRLATYGLWVESGKANIYRCGFSGITAATGGAGIVEPYKP